VSGKPFGKKTRKITAPRPFGPRVTQIAVPYGVVFRAFILGAVAVGACLWAIFRHSNQGPLPMHRTDAAPPSASAHPTEIEIESR
jgi:hypothetical protein